MSASACGGRPPTLFTIIPGGQALLNCSDSAAKVDLLRGKVLWRSTTRTSTDLVAERLYTTRNGLYVVRATTTPASGLEAEKVTSELVAYDMTTGQEAWTRPLEQSPPPGVINDESDSDWVIMDGPGRDGAGRLVLVLGDYVSAFDGTTGKPLWAVRSLSPNGQAEYAGYGIAIERRSPAWTAFDVQTGSELWSKPVPDVGANSYEPVDGAWQGIGQRGLSSVQIKTGQLLDNRLYPDEWEARLVTDSLALALIGDKLELYDRKDLRTALWSVDSGPVTPVAATRDLVIVKAESGLVVLDGSTGRVRDDLVLPQDATYGAQSDGLLTFTDAEGTAVLLLSPPAAVPAAK